MPTEQIEFKDFGKIPRFRTVTCVVTEKIDGTNAQIYVPEDEAAPIQIGSRNKWITPEHDNFGFARWATEHRQSLRLLGPGRHFGEWYGSGVGRRYGLDHKRFALFNTERPYVEGGEPGALPIGLPENVHLVPVLYRGAIDQAKISEVTEALYRGGSVAVPGWSAPEGVIVSFAGLRAKVTDNGDQHKGCTTSHSEVVQQEAAKDRGQRDAAQDAQSRALRATQVTRLPDDADGMLFEVSVTTHNDRKYFRHVRKDGIAEARTLLANMYMVETEVSP